MDIKELQKAIAFEIKNNIVICCDKGKHKFVPVEDGTLDVKCIKCGIKAMRTSIKIK